MSTSREFAPQTRGQQLESCQCNPMVDNETPICERNHATASSIIPIMLMEEIILALLQSTVIAELLSIYNDKRSSS
jgi:hypothetical protein